MGGLEEVITSSTRLVVASSASLLVLFVLNLSLLPLSISYSDWVVSCLFTVFFLPVLRDARYYLPLSFLSFLPPFIRSVPCPFLFFSVYILGFRFIFVYYPTISLYFISHISSDRFAFVALPLSLSLGVEGCLKPLVTHHHPLILIYHSTTSTPLRRRFMFLMNAFYVSAMILTLDTYVVYYDYSRFMTDHAFRGQVFLCLRVLGVVHAAHYVYKCHPSAFPLMKGYQ